MDAPIAPHPFEAGLDRHTANFVALSPVWFLSAPPRLLPTSWR